MTNAVVSIAVRAIVYNSKNIILIKSNLFLIILYCFNNLFDYVFINLFYFIPDTVYCFNNSILNTCTLFLDHLLMYLLMYLYDD